MKSALLLLALLPFGAPSAAAATLEITVADARGAPVADAVVAALPKGGPAMLRKRDAAIEQRDKTFIPLVSVVQTGTAMQFPNRDPIRHHVYSFSPAKPFELKLYAGTPAAPVIFDKPGEVVLGCNIHDHMLAYVYVVDTPWFAKTDAAGKARIEGLPPGDYDLQLTHYAQAETPAPKPVKARGEESIPAPFTVPLKALPPRPAPT
ncbi:MAG TPA: methylamine utilization protein [Usitatibacter sp.]|nr:methylamine utilization protein [Usitatibacter sp.]